MLDLEEYLYNKIKPVIESWNEDEIYAISFFVNVNEVTNNIPYFAISYNTEAACGNSPIQSEERWNYAFWQQNEHKMIGDKDSAKLLLQWYRENNIRNLGQEDPNLRYDENYRYIGKGPNGLYELLQIISNVAMRLHKEGVIEKVFHREIPIIIHDYEYTWYVIEATKNGNPDSLLEDFIKTLSDLGFL